VRGTLKSIGKNSTEAMSSRPKVLVPEKVSPDGLALLRQTLDIHEKKGLSADDILAIIGKSVPDWHVAHLMADRRL